jgi:hypothetical protein
LEWSEDGKLWRGWFTSAGKTSAIGDAFTVLLVPKRWCYVVVDSTLQQLSRRY